MVDALQQIYNRLAAGAVDDKMVEFVEPDSGPGAGTIATGLDFPDAITGAVTIFDFVNKFR